MIRILSFPRTRISQNGVLDNFFIWGKGTESPYSFMYLKTLSTLVCCLFESESINFFLTGYEPVKCYGDGLAGKIVIIAFVLTNN